VILVEPLEVPSHNLQELFAAPTLVHFGNATAQRMLGGGRGVAGAMGQRSGIDLHPDDQFSAGYLLADANDVAKVLLTVASSLQFAESFIGPIDFASPTLVAIEKVAKVVCVVVGVLVVPAAFGDFEEVSRGSGRVYGGMQRARRRRCDGVGIRMNRRAGPYEWRKHGKGEQRQR
jgi:hypothetical protein